MRVVTYNSDIQLVCSAPKTFQLISSLKIVANFEALLFLAAANINNVLGCGDLVTRDFVYLISCQGLPTVV